MSKSASLIPYLFFSGRCEEAIQFYSQALGAELVMSMRFSDSPDPVPEGQLEPGFEHRIMHADITIQGQHLMLSDGCDSQARFSGFSLSMAFPTEKEAQQAFTALSQQGQVFMPLGQTFWSDCFGMVQDQFGVQWMISVPTEAPRSAAT